MTVKPKLSAQQQRILQYLARQYLANPTVWWTRQKMYDFVGTTKGYSKALGAPNGRHHPNSLEALELVERRGVPPFEYRIAAAGLQLLELGDLVQRAVRPPLRQTAPPDDSRDSEPTGTQLEQATAQGVASASTLLPDDETPTSALANDVSAILADEGIGATEKQTLIKARLGQGAFRDGVLKRWDNRCSVTGSLTLAAIRASHVKPWRQSNPVERLDPNNGLPLVASLDALFDNGLISFDSSGALIVSHELNDSERKLLGVNGRSLRKMPSGITARYLDYHRKNVFRK